MRVSDALFVQPVVRSKALVEACEKGACKHARNSWPLPKRYGRRRTLERLSNDSRTESRLCNRQVADDSLSPPFAKSKNPLKCYTLKTAVHPTDVSILSDVLHPDALGFPSMLSLMEGGESRPIHPGGWWWLGPLGIVRNSHVLRRCSVWWTRGRPNGLDRAVVGHELDGRWSAIPATGHRNCSRHVARFVRATWWPIRHHRIEHRSHNRAKRPRHGLHVGATGHCKEPAATTRCAVAAGHHAGLPWTCEPTVQFAQLALVGGRNVCILAVGESNATARRPSVWIGAAWDWATVSVLDTLLNVNATGGFGKVERCLEPTLAECAFDSSFDAFPRAWNRRLCVCVSSLGFYAPPNADLGGRNKRWNPDFRLTFQWFVAQLSDTNLRNSPKIRMSSCVPPSQIVVWEGL